MVGVLKKGFVGSPYAVQDYKKINPAYGTEKDLKDLVEKAHRLGLKVLIDAVLNHTAWDNVLMKQHPEFYKRDQLGQVIPPIPAWWDVAALDYQNADLQAYMLGLLKWWVSEYNLDGFRFDASDYVPLHFWKKMREELKRLKPDILLLGEGEKPEALCVGFDLDYDWRFKGALDRILQDGSSATETIQGVLEEERRTFPRGAVHLRFSDNADEKRAIVLYGEKGALAASALIFTLNGVPLIYNGMEVGDTTESRDPALFEVRPISWETAEIRPSYPLFYSRLIALRKAHPALWHGTLQWIGNEAEDRVLTFLRKGNGETLLITLNMSSQPFVGTVALKGHATCLLSTTGNPSPQSLQRLSLGAWEFRIWKIEP